MRAGDKVQTRVVLPRHPAGMRGEVKEVGKRFVLVELEDGQPAYYLPRQLNVISSQDAERADDLGSLRPARESLG
jgi:hypothetical protein